VDNIATVPYLLGWDKTKARARAMELMERVGLSTTFAQRYPAQLSGGQQQRVGVARALAGDPPVMLMDEPFSAVDPVVRAELQEEFLRLQSDLDKTIIFVTHDIDEAVKLGDQVAVLRVGGRLAQIASPATLMTDPVDDFVAGFVGRDRGYRALGFEKAGELPTDDEKTVKIGDDGSAVQAAAIDGWALAVDEKRSPIGWVNAAGVPPGRTVAPELLQRGGTTAPMSGTLRAALDAALSSPSGRGVLVDENHALIGTIRAGEVIERIEAQLAARRQGESRAGVTS
jgi:osmoprotectant transport system ATP-binding protein